tara:strand:- start:306 stop:785 length:480 start_codon:yes stop_codon:yes gene_type:complete
MSTMYVNKVQELNVGSGVHIPGHVIQVVSANGPNSTVSFTGTTYTDINLSAAITPKFATSKILVKFNFVNAQNNSGAGSYQLLTRILRGSTGIYEVSRSPWGNSITGIGQMMHMEYIDSPSTTSATTYKVQVKNASAGGNVSAHMGNSNAQVILMEIAV